MTTSQEDITQIICKATEREDFTIDGVAYRIVYMKPRGARRPSVEPCTLCPLDRGACIRYAGSAPCHRSSTYTEFAVRAVVPVTAVPSLMLHGDLI